MKQPLTNPGVDQNWTWPEKTWFQERLNAIKAREQEIRRKPMVSSQRSVRAASAPDADQKPDAVEQTAKP